jgi:DNA topoisomerase-3
MSASMGTLKPSSALMAVIGAGTYARTEVVKKI